MNKGPSESREYEEIQTIKLQDLERGREYIVAEDTVLYTGAQDRPEVILKLPKGASFAVPVEVYSTIQFDLNNGVSCVFTVGALNVDEIKVLDR